jgi:hypothetical protein
MSGLLIELVMQDGSIAEMRVPDTVHNRQFQDFVARHESFALTQARSRDRLRTPAPQAA